MTQTAQIEGYFAGKLTDEVKAIAAYHRSLVARLNPDPIPLVTEEVVPFGQSREARLAAEHLASLSPERLAELEGDQPSERAAGRVQLHIRNARDLMLKGYTAQADNELEAAEAALAKEWGA